ncbi:MAG: thiamine pyrophosphate-requiring protein [Acidobacteriota bacterium]
MATPRIKPKQTQPKPAPYTGASALIEALNDAGVSYLFANFGSDHPGIMEALAYAKASGGRAPKVITCPNEMVALTCAQGYYQMSGKPQAVLIHVDCGTQSLAGAIHNVAKCRVPVIILAGASPYTQEGELKGTRNEFIHWLQDVPDQRGIVRGYMKYENELRTGRNVKQMMHRAMQIATSDPKGPVYLMAAREVFEEEIPPVKVDPAQWQKIASLPLPEQGLDELVASLLSAKKPLVVTSYLGRNPAAVGELVRLCDRLGIGVLESVPNYMNFPADHPCYTGQQGNEKIQNAALADADVVMVLDSDVPWIPLFNRPSAGAKICHIDVDPIKERTPLWYIPAAQVFRADCETALRQIHTRLDNTKINQSAVKQQRAHFTSLHNQWRDILLEKEKPKAGITPEYLTACVRRQTDRDTVIVNEGITNYSVINNHTMCSRPGTRFTSGASSLGWNGGAAMAMKLAAPDRTVVCMTGDGSFMFSVPATVHWMARKYKTPFLTVIFNNGGWRAPRFSMLGVHPDGFGSQERDLNIAFDPSPDYSAIAAAAGGAYGRKVENVADVEPAIAEALRVIREEKRCAVLDVILSM